MLQSGVLRTDGQFISLSNKIKSARSKIKSHEWRETLAAIEREGLYSKTFNKLYKDSGGSKTLPVDPTKLKIHFSNIFGKQFVLTPEKLRKVSPKPSDYDVVHYNKMMLRRILSKNNMYAFSFNYKDPLNISSLLTDEEIAI